MIVAPHLKLCILDRVFVESSLVKRSPCKLRGVLVSALLRRSPHKIFLGGVPVTLPGVFVSYKESLYKLRRSPCKLGGLLKISVFLLQTACHIYHYDL